MRYFLFLFLLACIFTSSVGFTLADERDESHSHEGDGGITAELANPLDSSISSIPAFFNVLVDIILVFAIPFIVFFIIYAGFLYVTAQGNPEKIQKAHAALLYALIGGMLILGANVLLYVITNTITQIK